MKEVRIYDPARTPCNWAELLAARQYAVFQYETKTGLHLGPDGNGLHKDASGTCLIFDSLEEAKNYCIFRIEQAPHITCEIFDKEGKAKPPVEIFVHRSIEAAQRSVFRSRFFWAHIMTILGIIGLLIDWRSDFVRMWPTILGLKFLTLALLFYAWGFAEKFRGHRFFKRFS